MADFADGALFEQDFDDVEPNLHRRVAQQAEVIQGGLAKQSPFAGVDGRSRARPVFGGARLHFDEHETIVMAKDQINFTSIRPEIGGNEFEAVVAEEGPRGLFTQFAATQVQRFLTPAPPTL
jgi:hypothetical protein